MTKRPSREKKVIPASDQQQTPATGFDAVSEQDTPHRPRKQDTPGNKPDNQPDKPATPTPQAQKNTADNVTEAELLPDPPTELLTQSPNSIAVPETLELAIPASKDVVQRDPLQLYLQEIRNFPLLDPDEELELARQVQTKNDQKAAFRLISSHLRLVVKIAMDFQRRWMQNVLDLVQEGNVGLMRAVQKFDPDRGIKFSYYASFWIKAYILKFIMDNWRLVKVGTTQAQRKLFYNLNRERQRLISQGFDPSAATLAQNLGVSEEVVVEMDQRLSGQDTSLNLPLGEEGSGSRMDLLPALEPGVEQTLAQNEIATLVRDRIKEILPKLTEKEEEILTRRLLSDSPATLREIGQQYGITRERVRQIEARLLTKLKKHFAENIQDFSQDWIEEQ